MTRQPEGPNAALADALSALRGGRLQEAEALCSILQASAPRESATHQLAAAIALQRGKFDDALCWSQSCLALRPAHAPAAILAGRAARGSGDLAQAAIWFGRARDWSPDRAEPAFLHCVTLLEQRDGDVHTMLQRLLRDFPNYADGWSEIGATLHKAGQQEAAVVAFARAAETSGEPQHLARLGAALRSVGRFSEAIAAFRKAAELAPDAVEYSMALGSCLREFGEAEQARIEFERALAVDGENSRLWFAMGLVSEDLRDTPGAISAYRKCTELNSTSPEAHLNLGLNLQKSGDLAAAMDSYRRAVQLRGDTFGRVAQALVSARKGKLWLNLGRLRRSLSC